MPLYLQSSDLAAGHQKSPGTLLPTGFQDVMETPDDRTLSFAELFTA